jgi:hypothetical protein
MVLSFLSPVSRKTSAKESSLSSLGEDDPSVLNNFVYFFLGLETVSKPVSMFILLARCSVLLLLLSGTESILSSAVHSADVEKFLLVVLAVDGAR